MNDRDIMKLALEALQGVYWSSRSVRHDEAITALRERLAQSGQEPVTLPHQMTPEMMKKVQMFSELGAYAAENWAGAYDTFQEFWQVAISALPAAPQRKPLSDEWIHRTTILMGFNPEWTTEIGIAHAIVRAAEAAHGIKEST